MNQLTETEVSKETTTNYKIAEKKQEIDNNNDCIVYCIDTSSLMNGEILNSVKSTVITQILVLEDTKPNCKVFIVECNDSIIIHCDCTIKPIRINGDIFYQYNNLVDVEKENVIFHNVKDTVSMLIERVFLLHVSWCIGLWQGLLISTVIAKKICGKIILWTNNMVKKGFCQFGYRNTKENRVLLQND